MILCILSGTIWGPTHVLRRIGLLQDFNDNYDKILWSVTQA